MNPAKIQLEKKSGEEVGFLRKRENSKQGFKKNFGKKFQGEDWRRIEGMILVSKPATFSSSS